MGNLNKEVKQNEEKYRFLIENSLDVIWVIDVETMKFIFVSPSVEKLRGFTAEEVMSQGVTRALSPESKKYVDDNLPARIAHFRETGNVEIYKDEIQQPCKDGTLIWNESLTYFHINPQNKRLEIIGSNRSIDERKITELKLKESQNNYDRLMVSAIQGFMRLKFKKPLKIDIPIEEQILWTIDNLFVAECNNIFANMYGFKSSEDIIGKSVVNIWDGEENARQIIENYLSCGYHWINLETREVTSAGNEKFFLNNCISIYNNDNEIVEMWGSQVEITKRKKADQILQQRNKELIIAKDKAEESDRLKTAFLASMSHEIRTPLNAIVGFSGIIADSSEGIKMKNFSRIIASQNELLLQLVDDLIDFSKLEAGVMEFHEEKFDINELINNLMLMFNSKLSTDVELVPVTMSKSFFILSDANRIKQLFSGLIYNAIKFTKKGSITFGYELDEQSEIEFFVKDTGIGIPNDQQKEIFKRFIKLDTFSQGTGLGLSIVKNIVKMMSGKVWLESETGKGSNFYFKLPIKIENLDKRKEKRKSITNKPKLFNSEITILIVEDNESNMIILEEILHLQKIKTLSATNGMEAIEVCKSNNDIDLVLMDLKMPVLDGFEATRKIKQFKPHLPIIAQTGQALSEDKDKAKEAGCDAYITKPIKRNELFELIRKFS